MAAFESVPYQTTCSQVYGWPYSGTNATTATTLYFPADSWAANVPLPPSAPEAPRESPREAKRRRARESSRKAVLAALAALRGLRDDPDPSIPPLARRGLSGRPAARKRVCAGSSRYRVLVN
jgi:hypothetical protein